MGSIWTRDGGADPKESASSSPAPVRCRGRLRVCLTAVTAAALLAGLVSPLTARPLSKCRLGYQSDYHSVREGFTDDVRKDVLQRVLIDALDDADIVFRGRLVKRWYLSDVLETDIPTILEVYGDARVLKGELPGAAQDGQVFLIRERICDGLCWLGALPEVTSGRDEPERVVLAMKNTLADPQQARDRRSNAIVYSGRIDALLGPCDPRQVNATLAAALITAPDEMDRLRRSYPPRTAEERQRDADFVVRLLGR